MIKNCDKILISPFSKSIKSTMDFSKQQVKQILCYIIQAKNLYFNNDVFPVLFL